MKRCRCVIPFVLPTAHLIPSQICRSRTVHLENTERKAVAPFRALCPPVSSTQSTGGGLGQAIDCCRSGAVLMGTIVHLLAVRCYGSHTQDPSPKLSTPRSACQGANATHFSYTQTTNRGALPLHAPERGCMRHDDDDVIVVVHSRFCALRMSSPKAISHHTTATSVYSRLSPTGRFRTWQSRTRCARNRMQAQ